MYFDICPYVILSMSLFNYECVLVYFDMCPYVILSMSLFNYKCVCLQIIKTYDIRFWPMTSGKSRRNFDLEDPPQWAKNDSAPHRDVLVEGAAVSSAATATKGTEENNREVLTYDSDLDEWVSPQVCPYVF